MADKLTVLETESDKHRKLAKALLLEQAEEGYDRVTVLGFKNGQLHYQSSATPNFLEDIGAMVVCALDRYHASTKEQK